jgi:hypothetical protein
MSTIQITLLEWGVGTAMNTFVLVLVLAVACLAGSAAAAMAAPQLELSGGGPPPVMAPDSIVTNELTFTNIGDADVTSGSATITVMLPDELRATAAEPVLWTGCSINATGRVVTCTGPVAGRVIAPAASTCSEGADAQVCPIRVTYKVVAGAPLGGAPVESTISACLGAGGAPPCSMTVKTTAIQNFGDGYGFAPINQPGAETVPAIPLRPEVEDNKAFWAGACDRTSAPAFGDPIAAPGIGSIPNTVWAPGGETPDPALARVQVPAPAVSAHCIDVGEPTIYPNAGTIYEPGGIWFEKPDWRLPPVERAGGHPDGSTTMAFARDNGNEVDGAVDNIYVDLPPGFVGNPNAVDKCSAEEFAVKPPRCSPSSQIGVLHLLIKGRTFHAGHGPVGNHKVYPIWNLEPREGRVAEFGFAYASGEEAVSVRLTGKARTNGDFGVTAFTGQVPVALEPIIQTITIWGVPWDSANDIWRVPAAFDPKPPCSGAAGYIPFSGLTAPGCAQSYEPSWGDIKPFFSQETDCNPSPVVKAWTDSYQNPGAFTADGDPVVSDSEFDTDAIDPGWKTAASDQAAVNRCEDLDFAPSIAFGTTTSAADGATGLSVDLDIPQNNLPRSAGGDPLEPPAEGASQSEIDDYVEDAVEYWKSDDGRATSHLKDTVVTLPPGVSLNPSAATGLTGCDDATIGVRQQGNPLLFDNSDPSDGLGGDDCPNGSKIGTVEVETPLLDEALTGDVILGTPETTNPQGDSGKSMFRTFLVLRSKARGLIAKIYGTTVADGTIGEGGTGRLTATFENNPELPFDRLRLNLKGGSKGLLAMPQRCGAPAWSASFTPWSSVGAPVAVPDTPDSGAFDVSANCAFGFAPTIQAGMSTPRARANGTFSFKFSRPEGQQWARGLTAQLPTGLLASVRGVPLCGDAQAASGSCPASSQIGIVDATAGSGEPFVLEQKGEVFLTEGYKGGEYGLAVKIRPIAGPFRGSLELSPIIVRQAIHVDRRTAQVTAISDPFPLVHHGIPLRARDVTVLVNRPAFTLNPSDCEAKQVGGVLTSSEGATAAVSYPFRATGCSGLSFKPKLGLQLTGRKQIKTGRHPGVKAVVQQAGIPEAGIERAEVRLPKSLALDPANAQALCEFEDGTSANPEDRCPRGSIVGRARAVSPLLNEPLVGNVYFVKNVRRSSTGNLIRTLPMLIVALRGEISINLRGESDVDNRARLVNTFNAVPDAPISQFSMNINGGSNGILAVTGSRRGNINLCAKPKSHVAEADMDGQNGKRHDFDVRMKTPCTKKQTRAAKRAAARRAARDR